MNCIKEQRNFRYILDKNGKLTDKTTHTWSHGMDARRYGVVGLFGKEPEDIVQRITYNAMAQVKIRDIGRRR